MNDILIKFIIASGTIGTMFGVAGFLTWVERKQSAVMQDRIGANRATIFGFKALGLFHAIADVLKMLSKEEFIPQGANKFLFNLAPYLSVTFALVGFAAIPIGNQLVISGKVIELQAANLNIALIFIFAMMSMGVYGVVLGGFSSNNNYAFLGGMRGAAQMIAYEITMGAAIMGVIMVYNTLDLQMLVRGQGDYMLGGWLPKWGIFCQPLSFVLFLTAATAETKRTPFDLPEGESEIIGYFVEYSGMKFGMFFMADLVETVLVSALMTTLFLGGWQIPYLHPDGFHFPWGGMIAMSNWPVAALGVVAFFVKLSVFIWLLMAVRWTLPRFRYDQLMNLGWKILLPASLINIALTAIVMTLLRQTHG
ncbi:MAG: NADH-quinone oxidoreductase subunit H [Candidatus Omnitrophica bacterium]|nr:NADH-quinone oxidoreductase subunit H [Candidatus Omnitrophota bacterium]